MRWQVDTVAICTRCSTSQQQQQQQQQQQGE